MKQNGIDNGILLENIEIVPITDDDYQFGYDIRKLTMEEHIRKTYGEYNEIEQIESYKNGFFTLKHHKKFVIKYLGENIGWLNYEENDTNMEFNQLFIHPKYQGKGIGSKIINNLITVAKDKNKEIILDVLKSNYKAKKLYLKLGFNMYNENEADYFLKYEIK
jgi:ribosomal protein S18 acetylase RimI-like enzyme